MDRFFSKGRAALALVCGGSILLGHLHAAGPAAPGDLPPSALSFDGGFTRETLLEFDAPEPAPFAPAPRASLQDENEPARPRSARRVRRAKAQPSAAQGSETVVVAKPAPRRNPVTSFVYWWNGWVIRTFHTRIGTVLLDKIGAKA